MVQFGTGFYTPMDREYGTSSLADTSTNDAGLSIGDIGMSMALGPVPNVQQVASKLRAGVKTVELGFMGQGKGSGQGHTPGMYGKKQRQALSEMQRANKVDFTTHATVGVYGVAGMTQQGGFSKESRKFSIDEIKRAVEFAADVAEGGPVVVHTGEFPRPMVDAEWNEKDPKWKGKFQAYDEEGGRTSYKVVDTRTGGLLHEARKNMKVNRAKWKRYQEGDEYWEEHKGNNYTDENGKLVTKEDYIDFFGNRIDPAHRVPVFDKKENRFVTEAVGWEGLKKDAKEMTERAKKFWREHKDNGKDDWEKSMWLRFKDVKSEDEIRIRPEEAFVIATFETQAANARGYALY